MPARAEDSTLEATSHLPRGTGAATEPGRKSVLSPAPTVCRGNQRNKYHRGHMSALQRQAASSLRIDLVNGSSWLTRVLTSPSIPAGSFRNAGNGSTKTSVQLAGIPSIPTDGNLSASTWVYAGITRGSSWWPTSHISSSAWIFLSHFGLLVDFRNNRLLDGVTSLSLPSRAASSLTPASRPTMAA
jgi:hypothetical protein